MAYFNELSFASGHYHIDPYGVIELDDDLPIDVKRKFWTTWVDMRKVIIENEKKLIYISKYPTIPIEDEDPNFPQYKELLGL